MGPFDAFVAFVALRASRVSRVCVCRARPESRALASFYLQVDVFLLARRVTQSVLDLL